MTLPSPDELRRLIEAATQEPLISETAQEQLDRQRARYILQTHTIDLARAYLALTEENARLKKHIDGLRVLGTELSQAGPTWQCPNCGSWHHQHEPRAHSSSRHSTLYGVCQKCADNHTAFAALAEARK